MGPRNPRSIRRLLLVIACLAIVIAPEMGSHLTATAKSGSLSLFVASDRIAPAFQPLDPLSLETLDRPAEFTLAGKYPTLVISGDGSTLVAIEQTNGDSPRVRVEDAVTHAVRTTFNLESDTWAALLAFDGSVLVVQRPQTGGITGSSPPVWDVFDTATGELLSTIAGEGQGLGNGFHAPLLDPAGKRLYVPFVAASNEPNGPWPLQIAAYDLRTGAELARIDLVTVLAGIWYPSRAAQSLFVIAMQAPGIAISPDGVTLAVVDPATGHIITIDAATLTYTRTIEPKQNTSLIDRALGWLSPLPEKAGAKVMSGSLLRASYSADGESLYVMGRRVDVGETAADISPHLLGIQRIDLRGGEIAAGALEGADIEQLWVAPDGSAIYALGYDDAWEFATTPLEQHLRKLNPRTLDIEADRVLPSRAWVVIAWLPDRTTS